MVKEIHKKCWPQYYEAIRDRIKPFEIRKDEDDVQVGDILIIEEWDGDYTGYSLKRKVTYVLRDAPDFGLKKGYCIVGLDHRDPDEYKNPDEVTVGELLEVLCRQDKKAIVHNGYEENIRIYPGSENKPGGRKILMIC
jgi:hypothetical protein